MPSVSKAQHHLMLAVAHNPEFAKKAGIPVSVGKDFAAADKATKKFAAGGSAGNESLFAGNTQMRLPSPTVMGGHGRGMIAGAAFRPRWGAHARPFADGGSAQFASKMDPPEGFGTLADIVNQYGKGDPDPRTDMPSIASEYPSPDASVGMAKGLASGFLGSPGDIAHSLLPKDYQKYNPLPTSAEVQSHMPVYHTDHIGDYMAGNMLGTQAGGAALGVGVPLKQGVKVGAAASTLKLPQVLEDLISRFSPRASGPSHFVVHSSGEALPAELHSGIPTESHMHVTQHPDGAIEVNHAGSDIRFQDIPDILSRWKNGGQ